MDECCVVVSGSWCRGVQGIWEFSVDDELLSRVIDLRKTRNLVELEDLVLKEFGLLGDPRPAVKFSYLPKSTPGRYFAANTPPVVIGSDTALVYYKKMYDLDADIGLCVNFGQVKKLSEQNSQLEEQAGFVTPLTDRRKNTALDFCCGSSSSAVNGYGSVTPRTSVKRKIGLDPGSGISNSLGKETCHLTPIPSGKRSAGLDLSGGISSFAKEFVNDTSLPSVKRSTGFDLGGVNSRSPAKKAVSGGLSDIDEDELLHHVENSESELVRQSAYSRNVTPGFSDAFVNETG